MHVRPIDRGVARQQQQAALWTGGAPTFGEAAVGAEHGRAVRAGHVLHDEEEVVRRVEAEVEADDVGVLLPKERHDLAFLPRAGAHLHGLDRRLVHHLV